MSTLLPPAPLTFWRESRAEIIKSVRLPQFIIPTIALPPAFFALFAFSFARGNAEAATQMLATFGVFAVMGPALFGFGANLSSERESGQLELKRLSPMPAGAQITSKIAATVACCAVVFAILYALAAMVGVALSPFRWTVLVLVHTVSVIPFAFLGIGIGYRFGPGAAVAIANIAFLALAVLGGLWFPISSLPQAIQSFAWALPSYHLAQIALMAAGLADLRELWLHAGPLLGITVAAGIFAWTGERSQSR